MTNSTHLAKDIIFLPLVKLFNFVPVFIWMYRWRNIQSGGYYESFSENSMSIITPSDLTTSYDTTCRFFFSYVKKSSDGKTVYWYSHESVDYQKNHSHYEYYYIALG